MVVTGSLGTTEPPIHALPEKRRPESSNVRKSYAEVFTGVRQDSGDAMLFIKTMREFYDREGIKVGTMLDRWARADQGAGEESHSLFRLAQY